MVSTQSKNVIIIGAGAAGIAAFYHLRDSGFNLIMLEARDRIGGRVYSASSSMKGYNIEYGAQYLHDTSSQWTFSKLIKETHTDYSEHLGEMYIFSQNKMHVSQENSFAMLKNFLNDRDTDRDSYSKKISEKLREVYQHKHHDKQRVKDLIESYYAINVDKASFAALADAESSDFGDESFVPKKKIYRHIREASKRNMLC